MTFLFRFMIAAIVVVGIADIIPFPNFPPGFMVQMMSQNLTENMMNSKEQELTNR